MKARTPAATVERQDDVIEMRSAGNKRKRDHELSSTRKDNGSTRRAVRGHVREKAASGGVDRTDMMSEVLGTLVQSVQTMTDTMGKGFARLEHVFQSCSLPNKTHTEKGSCVKLEIVEKKAVPVRGKQKRTDVEGVGNTPVHMFNSRMSALMNCYDIVTSTECVQMAVAHAVMVEFIQECRGGKHLTPDAFLRVL